MMFLGGRFYFPPRKQLKLYYGGIKGMFNIVTVGKKKIKCVNLEFSAYTGPESGVFYFNDKAEYRKTATIKDLEDYFACGFKYLYVESSIYPLNLIKEMGGEGNAEADIYYMFDLAKEYESIHGEGSCPVLFLDGNVLAVGSGGAKLEDVKDEIKKVYNKLKSEYSTCFAGYLLRDEPMLWLKDEFVQVYDYIYNELGGKDLVYLVSLLPSAGLLYDETAPAKDFAYYLVNQSYPNKGYDISGFKEFIKDNEYGIKEHTYYAEYLYYLESFAKAYKEKGIKNVLFGTDFYPYRTIDGKDEVCYSYLSTLEIVGKISRKYGYDMFITLQAYTEGFPMTLFTNGAFVVQQALLAICYGAKHLSYFNYQEHFRQFDGFKYNKAMVMWDNSNGKWERRKTEYYDWIKSANTGILPEYSLFTGLKWQGTTVKEGRSGVVSQQREFEDYKDDVMTVIENDEDVAIGCFTGEDGIKGYLAVNMVYPKFTNELTLKIRIEKPNVFLQADRKFVEITTENKEYELKIVNGEAAAIIAY